MKKRQIYRVGLINKCSCNDSWPTDKCITNVKTTNTILISCTNAIEENSDDYDLSYRGDIGLRSSSVKHTTCKIHIVLT